MGGLTCTASKPMGPRKPSHSSATSVHDHSWRVSAVSAASVVLGKIDQHHQCGIVAYEEVYEGRTAAHRRSGARAGEEEQEEGDEVDEAHFYIGLIFLITRSDTKIQDLQQDTILMKKGGRLLAS